MSDQPPQFTLVREHYLKRELLKREIDHEVALLNDFRDVGMFGSPFSSHGPAPASDGYDQFPILRHMFDRYVRKFPFLEDVDEHHFWGERVQPFIESLAGKDISDSADRAEETKRKKMGRKIQRLILSYASSGFQTTRKEEKNVEVETEKNMKKGGVMEIDASKLIAETAGGHYINGYYINVEGVREISIRRSLFADRKVWQYIVRAQMSGAPELRVGRTFDDFKDLDSKLRIQFPGKKLPKFPAKYKALVNLQTPEEIRRFHERANSDPSVGGSAADDDDRDHESDEEISPDVVKKYLSFKSLSSIRKSGKGKLKIPREKQRITLRAYIRGLQEIPQVVKSDIFLEFLFKGRLPSLTESELDDIAVRKKLDLIRVEDQLRFLKIAQDRARNLEIYVKEFKQDMKKGGQLIVLFDELKQKDKVEDLSPRLQQFMEWAIVQFSATVYQLFLGGDNSPELYSQMKRIHHLMPYTVLRGILKYSNPMAIMKGMTDLFLAVPPFSKRSLLQSMFIMVLSDDAKEQEHLIEDLKVKVPDEMTMLIANYVNSPYVIRRAVQKYSEDSGNLDIIMSLFEFGDYGNIPRTQQMLILTQVRDWYTEWNKAVEDPDALVDSVKVNEYSQLKELLRLHTRLRDKKQMQEFWADESTMNLIKEVVSIFYSPLVKLFKMANMSRSVHDFEKFMDDLIKLIDRADGLAGSALDANQMVEELIALCHKHKGSVFRFIHDVYKNDKDQLFERLIRWVSTIMDVLRNGTGKQLDIEALLKQPNINKADVIKEIDSVIRWSEERKKIRMAMMGSQPAGTAWDSALPTGGMTASDFGLNDLEEEDDEDDEEDDILNSEEGDDHVEQGRILRKKLAARQALQEKLPQLPEFKEIPKLLDSFHHQLSQITR